MTLDMTMSLSGDITDRTTLETESDAANSAEGGTGVKSNFRFVPRELFIKCRKLIESYHAIYGYAGLPDMLWLSDARDIIESHRDLTQVFKIASKSRGAKRANDSFLAIAAAVVSLEVLARDFAGWGNKFPAAKRQAEKLLGDYALRPQRAWLMDLYLYPTLGMRREFANALAATSTDIEALEGG
jgi:hypothetical protein